MNDDELYGAPYESGYGEKPEELFETAKDNERSARYDNNQISMKKSLLLFGIVAVLMITIFVLDMFKVIPWWGTMVGSLLIVVVIFIAYIMVKAKNK